MELLFLGTGAGAPSRRRNVSSIALRLTQSPTIWLFDCGEGTQQQLLRSPIHAGQIERIFITHLHGDHIFGLPGLLGSRSLQYNVTSPVFVYGPSGIKRFIESALDVSGTHHRFLLTVQEWPKSTHLNRLAFADERINVSVAPLEHGIPSLGYAVEELPQPGRFRVEYARQLQIPEGPLYGRLKQGENVILPDGRKLRGADFTDPPRPGRKVVILGDTRPCEMAVKLARQADVLIHEATFANAESEMALKRGHSTAREAAMVALAANVKLLMLTHISPRYAVEAHGALRPAQTTCRLLAEAQSVFPHSILAEDFFTYEF